MTKHEAVLKEHFGTVYKESTFVRGTYTALKRHGFSDDNAIVSVCVCRDEISQSLRSIIKHVWGEAFNLSSLAGMFTAGKTGLQAAMHHAPQVGGKERYVFYALPHVAIDEKGTAGITKRKGITESNACGALFHFLGELTKGKISITLDEDDIEESLLKRRLLREIPYGHIPDLIELTKIARKVIQADLEHVIKKLVNTHKSDYSMMTGVQIHVPSGNFVWPSESYAIIDGTRHEIIL